MNRFDTLAQGWDIAPIHLERTRALAHAIRNRIPLAGLRALEVGAGTGLLSFAFADELAQAIVSDPSQGMIEVLQAKITAAGLPHLHAAKTDDSLESIEGDFDLVFLQMALHHIPDVAGFMARAYAVLKPGGHIALADLDTEDGSFHGPEVTDVHLGFDRTEVVRMAESAGFIETVIETGHVMDRVVEGKPRSYPVFLLTARRPL